MKLGILKDTGGQMTVELAVMIPVMLVVGLIIFNLGLFLYYITQFDRLSSAAILSHGVSPSGEQNLERAKSEVEAVLKESFTSAQLEVAVDAEKLGGALLPSGGGRIAFPISPFLTRFSCSLRFRPWPSAVSFLGQTFEFPLWIEHKKELVVDRFRAGVVA